MAKTASSTATINRTLSNYAAGLAQDLSKSLASFVAPEVPTGNASGQYKKYDDKNAFQVYNTRRAVGGKARRIEFSATDPYFNCAPNALEIGIDDHEREQAGDDGEAQLQEAKTRTLVTSATISHEKEVFDAVWAGLSAVAGLGVYSNPDVDPIDEIDSQIEAIAIDTGMMPNRIALGIGAWRVVKNHPKVRERISGITPSLQLGAFAGLLLNPAIEARVGVLSRDQAKFGGAKNARNIVGAEILVFLGTDPPTVEDPSFAKTFRTRSGGVDRVEMYREESTNGDILRVQWTSDIKVVASACGRRISVS